MVWCSLAGGIPAAVSLDLAAAVCGLRALPLPAAILFTVAKFMSLVIQWEVNTFFLCTDFLSK